MSVKVDFVSDLHIEMWDKEYNIKHPCGERKNNPLDINIFKNSDSKILIVAGDISDTLELSVEKLDELAQSIKKLLSCVLLAISMKFFPTDSCLDALDYFWHFRR